MHGVCMSHLNRVVSSDFLECVAASARGGDNKMQSDGTELGLGRSQQDWLLMPLMRRPHHLPKSWRKIPYARCVPCAGCAPHASPSALHRTSTPCQGLPLARYAARLPRITLDRLPHSAPAQTCSVPTATPTSAGRTPHGVRVFANPGHGILFCSEHIVGCTCTIRFHMDDSVQKVYEANTAASTCRAGHLHRLRAGLRQRLGRRRSSVNCVRRTINRAGDGRRPRQANNDQCSRMRVGFEHEWSFV
jgi:hypothetical protein